MKERIKDKIDQIDWIQIGEVVAICLIIIPILGVSLYALPAADDFSDAFLVRNSMADQHYSYGVAAIKSTILRYKIWGGYYFANFLNLFISSFSRGGVQGLRFTVFVINLFFYSSLCYFVVSFLKTIYHVKNKRVLLLACLLMLWIFTNGYCHSETWTWNCVLVAYVLVVACMFWGDVFLLKAIKSDKVVYTILAAVIGFLASGGSLNITALNCGLYLLIGFIGYRVYNRKGKAIICFASALLGGIINVTAPGNFARHSMMQLQYDILGAAKAAAYEVWSRLQYLFFESPFILTLVVFFLAILMFGGNYDKVGKIHPILLLFIVLCGIIIINFPVCLGYGRFTADRCAWVEECGIYLGAFGWTANLAIWIRNNFGNFEIRKDVMLCIIVSSLFFGCNLGNVRNLDNYPTIQMMKQLMNGDLRECAEFWEEVLLEIESANEKNVVVYRNEIKTNPFLYCIGITSDQGHWINIAVAEYYDKDSVCIMIND